MSRLTNQQLNEVYWNGFYREGHSLLNGLLAVADAAVQAEREACAKLAESDAFYGSAVQEPVAIRQFRKVGCTNWYDGHADHKDGHGPYEERAVYLAKPVMPEGWSFTRCENGEIIISHGHGGIGGVVVERNPRHAREIPESILWALADAMLTAKQGGPT